MRIDVLLPAASVSPLMPGVGTVLLIAALMLLPAAIVYVWTALALARVFSKLGIDEWKAWVPFYNMAVVLGLGGMSGWLLLLLLIPVFGAIFVYVATVTAAHRIGGMFGVGTGMTVLAALLFPVWASVLGFGSARALSAPAREGSYRDQDADAVYRSLFPEPDPDPEPEHDPAPGFDGASARRGHAPRVPSAPEQDVFASRREVAPPSAWIPPLTAAPEPPAASAPVEPPASAPSAAPASLPPTEFPASPRSAPTREPAPTPVTSWWQPAEPAEPMAPAQTASLWSPAERTPAPEPDRTPEPEPLAEPAPPAPVSRAVLREAYLLDEDRFEDSGEISAVVGSPVAGPPRSAAAAVSAARSGVGDIIEDTVIASRRTPRWMLRLPDGTAVDLSGESVVLGRRPERVAAAPGAQLVAVVDATRTVSKTHALLRRRAEAWLISDLGSTNGIVVFQGAEEIEVSAGTDAEVVDRFLLGDAELSIARRELV